MKLRALLVSVSKHGTWLCTYELPIAPFPGLGIRLDVYDMVNVHGVVVGDPNHDVTCFVTPEGGEVFEPARWMRLGFEEGTYP